MNNVNRNYEIQNELFEIAQQINAYDAKIAEYSDIIARAINYRDKLETERQELVIEYEGLL